LARLINPHIQIKIAPGSRLLPAFFPKKFNGSPESAFSLLSRFTQLGVWLIAGLFGGSPAFISQKPNFQDTAQLFL
jgi:hypothetical protein